MASDRAAQSADLPLEAIHGSDGRIEHPRVRRERCDVGFRPVLGFVILSILVGAAILGSIWIGFGLAERQPKHVDDARHPLAMSEESLPKRPRLEQLDRMRDQKTGEVRSLEAAELQRLDQFGSTNEQGYVHIPIDLAMELVVPKLPVRDMPKSSYRTLGLVNGGESNSGRMFRGQQ